MDQIQSIPARCVLFPRSESAVSVIEKGEFDSRFEIEIINFDYSTFSKLQLFGFFTYPSEMGITIRLNSFIKIPWEQVPHTVVIALQARKETNERALHKFIDRFVNAAGQSKSEELPIWFNT